MGKGTVWVLGASTGLGFDTARAFAQDGWLVVGGARSFAGADPQASPGDGIHRVGLDVTDPQSREAFVTQALALSPRVDALIYCAAVLVLGSCEETGQAEFERVMRTNFLGMTGLVSLALPIMRKQGGGKIVLFSSINGLLGIPFQSAYTASKHAVEGYAECLAMETHRFGVQVCLVEPGDHRGGSQKCRLHATREDASSPYASAYEAACGIIHHDEANGLPPEELGRKVLRNVNRSRMRTRLRVAKPDQRLAVVLHDLLPGGLNNRILRDYYAKKGRE